MAGKVERPSVPDTFLSTLDRAHPRLVLKAGDLDGLRKLIETDSVVKRCYQALLKRADSISRKPVLVYDKIGPRLLSVSRECVNRIYTLGLAWRLTAAGKYAQKAQEELLAVCAFRDWNPPHFLDTAEMSHAVGVGYDWFFNYLDEVTRRRVKAGLIDKGLKPGLRAYSERAWWTRSEFNWNQVCNSGLIIGVQVIARHSRN